ncbi:hypothetical protein Kpol_397p7 [Vanderwaltozyma polyspora DSM 70294]|uniref:Hyaluronan/mRNA-binding protein domain-containing protein n=1 Tax=Vanderwaltozyma polyspora (strain ATCC 22028 / DSM 70294 / BCRC 21397 / CBS 2163 / NBRC 10782 / NRRL Y-8283 / UCD 57-17) TaxID=436907 RepID=A7TRF9_VANPO|nr:uncharacterized protein Kpol_397p7 [Vanderwaltozyma polyspora DSM 70294]EDO15148.1 hypothetical protein Kpol_397p7 [Vanderwaltozyma polyspora DSM 70294]
MSNPFDVLGNDVEDANVVLTAPKELVKKTTSSKKADVPPPSANPARANKNRPQPTGNERAIRDKAAGRQQNRSKDSPASAATKKSNTRRGTDRQSRSGKVDTQKRVNRGWGDDRNELDAETEAKADADAELAGDVAAQAAVADNRMSLNAYLQEVSSNDLNKKPEVAREAEALENAEIVFKEEEVLVEASKTKNVKSKQLKVKEFLTFDATFSDALPQQRSNGNRGGRNARGRGGRNNTRGGRKPTNGNNGNHVEKKQGIDTANLPSLA